MSNRRFISTGLALSLLAIVVAGAIGGRLAAIGMTMGLAFTTFSVLVTWFLIKIASTAADNKATPLILVGMLALFKLPLLGVAVVLAVKLGMAALIGFLTGVVLVYFALIWRVQTMGNPADRL